MLSEIDKWLVRDAKARDYAEVAGCGLFAYDRSNARRWLRRNGYEHLIPGYGEDVRDAESDR